MITFRVKDVSGGSPSGFHSQGAGSQSRMPTISGFGKFGKVNVSYFLDGIYTLSQAYFAGWRGLRAPANSKSMPAVDLMPVRPSMLDMFLGRCRTKTTWPSMLAIGSEAAVLTSAMGTPWPQKEEEKQATLATTTSIHAFFIAHYHLVIRHCMICMSKTVDWQCLYATSTWNSVFDSPRVGVSDKILRFEAKTTMSIKELKDYRRHKPLWHAQVFKISLFYTTVGQKISLQGTCHMFRFIFNSNTH